MKKRCNKWLLSMLMVIALFFYNADVTLATEITEADISVESDDVSESTDFVRNVETVDVANIDDTDNTGSTAPDASDSNIVENNATDNFVPSDIPITSEYNNDDLTESNNEDEQKDTLDITDVDDEYVHDYNDEEIKNDEEIIVEEIELNDEIKNDEEVIVEEIELNDKIKNDEEVIVEEIELNNEIKNDEEVIVEEIELDDEIKNDEEIIAEDAEFPETMDIMSLDSNIVATTNQLEPIVVPDVPAPTSYTEVYERIIAWQDTIPTGTPWDDHSPYGDKGYLGSSYTWKGSPIKNGKSGVGCAAFAFILSDAAFGNSPSTTIDSGNFKFEDIRVGDLLRINNNSHFVIVLQTSAAGVIVAEANYNGKVHWGRSLSVEDVMYATFIVTRYPNGFVSDDEEGANDIVDQGKEGDFTWTLTKSGILTISGSGAMPNFSNDNPSSWSKTTYSVNSIVIENGITSIGDNAFFGSSAMSIDIPSTVTKIGDNAFMKSNLIGVSIPGSVTTIGYQAFRECANLASLTLNEGTITIGDYAFRGCTKIAYKLNIPASVITVGEGAFWGCAELMTVQFASSNSHTVTIGDNAFLQCWKMLSIKLPEKLINISSGMFYSCQMLGYLYIPASVQSISTIDGDISRLSPFGASAIMQIDFGGSEEIWKAIGGNTALNDAHMLSSVTVNFNVSSTTTPSNPDEPDDSDDSDNSDNSDDSDNSGSDDNTDTDIDTGTGSTTPSNPDEPDDSDDSNNSDNSDNSDNSGSDDNTDTDIDTGTGSTTPSNPDEPDDSDDSDNSDNSYNSDYSDNSGSDNNTDTDIDTGTGNTTPSNPDNSGSGNNTGTNAASLTSGKDMAGSVSDYQDEKVTDDEQEEADEDVNADVDDSVHDKNTSDDNTSLAMDESSYEDLTIGDSTKLQNDANESKKSNSIVLIGIVIAGLAGGLLILKSVTGIEAFKKKLNDDSSSSSKDK